MFFPFSFSLSNPWMFSEHPEFVEVPVLEIIAWLKDFILFIRREYMLSPSPSCIPEKHLKYIYAELKLTVVVVKLEAFNPSRGSSSSDGSFQRKGIRTEIRFLLRTETSASRSESSKVPENGSRDGPIFGVVVVDVLPILESIQPTFCTFVIFCF